MPTCRDISNLIMDLRLWNMDTARKSRDSPNNYIECNLLRFSSKTDFVHFHCQKLIFSESTI